jgi:hypothetical protein
MNGTEPESSIGPLDLALVDAAGDITTLALWEGTSVVWGAGDDAALDQAVADYLADIQETQPANAYQGASAVLSPIKLGVDDGTITPAQGGQFLRWLNYNKGVTAITNDSATTATITGYLSQWIIEQSGLVPTGPLAPVMPAPAPITPTEPAAPLVPNPAPAPVLPTPTVGQTVITKTVIEVVPQQVQSTGSSGPTAAQVQKAIGIAFADAMKAQAAAIDAMLPSLKPGQVPQALDQLNQATHVLENQLNTLRATTTGHAQASLSSQITALQAAVKTDDALIAQLQAQMAEQAPSGLSEDLGVVKGHQLADEANIAALEAAVAGLASGGALTSLEGSVSALQRQMDLVDPSPLDTATNAAQATATQALTAAEAAQECCDDAHAQLGDDETALGGKSALPSLGKLAGAALGLLGFISLLETIEAIANLPLALKGIIADTTTIAGWAETAAPVIVADMSWADGLNAN